MMKYGKELTTVLFATALGCGGKLLDMPNGYGPVGEDGSAGDDGAAGDDGGGGFGGSSSGSSGGSSSGGRSSSGGSASSSSGGRPATDGGPQTCGGRVCTGNQVCCVATGGGGGAGGGGGGGQTCTAPTACTGLALSCVNAAGCGTGNVCCFALGGGGAGAGGGGGGLSGAASCQKACPQGGYQLCSSNAECPRGVTCQMTMFGGSVCGGVGGGGGGGLAGGLGGLGGAAGGGLGGLLCAHPETPIATPDGERPIASLQVGDIVLSVDHGQVRPVPILRVNRSPAVNHHVVSAILENGRVLHISEGHPTADGRLFRDLAPGDRLGDVPVLSVQSIPYDADATYDILPASDTGAYFAAGALIGSTLFK
jgi:hypothetical protein